MRGCVGQSEEEAPGLGSEQLVEITGGEGWLSDDGEHEVTAVV